MRVAIAISTNATATPPMISQLVAGGGGDAEELLEEVGVVERCWVAEVDVVVVALAVWLVLVVIVVVVVVVVETA